jgi:oligopeptide/dipeptide ABC transporter ATP-binding protein
MAEEVFGPVLPILTVDGPDEAIARIRERDKPLTAYVFTEDRDLERRFADRIGVLYGGVLMETGPAHGLIDHPTHPYSRALIGCIPRRREAGRRQAGIEGLVPGVADWFDGCRFAPRCPRVGEDCRHGRIEMTSTRPAQAARCLYPL